ncbi:MAG: hydrogenase 3 maturation endopeptidase HyCI [Thermoplasmata archaeon]|nr:MAG: hydrogenase 3 maturation endopeptidase HyCI [Thermoplasmata archaeon]RLF64647.1 MAG: hydrogenase 3 maturation endopeptidase HyCI [Thermoplasmata archaeon]
MMNILLGVGNEANGDDGIGVWVARNFSHEGWRSIDCFTVPENYTSEIKRSDAKKVVIVDAADMGLDAGEMRIIPKDRIGLAGFSTHSLPLSIFIKHIQETKGVDVILIGIQPEQFYSGISEKVMEAGKSLLEILRRGSFEEIEVL